MLNYIIVFLISIGIGYVVYPLVFTMEGAGDSSLEQVTVSGPNGRMSFDIDMNSITPEEMPAEVKLRESAQLRNSGGMTLQLEKSYNAKVLGFGGGMLRITDQSGKFSGEVPFQQTDVLKAIGEKRMYDVLGIESDADRKKAAEEKAKQKAAEEKARIAAQKELEMKKSAVVEEAKPEPKVAESSGPLTETLAEADLINAMQDSIKKKMVSEFSFDGVLKWEAGENETLSDTEYQIGFATYEKETIFGKQPVVAKALVRNGKVTKWVYAKTGLDIP